MSLELAPMTEPITSVHIPEPIDLTKIPLYCGLVMNGIDITIGIEHMDFEEWVIINLKTTVQKLHKAFLNKDKPKIEDHFEGINFEID